MTTDNDVEATRKPNPWGFFLILALAAPLALFLLPSVISGRIGRGEQRQNVSPTFRVFAAIAVLWGAYSIYAIAAIFVPSLAPELACSDKQVTDLAAQVLIEKVIGNSSATATITGVRTVGSEHGRDCDAQAIVSGAVSSAGEHTIRYHVQKTDDGKSFYVSVRMLD